MYSLYETCRGGLRRPTEGNAICVESSFLCFIAVIDFTHFWSNGYCLSELSSLFYFCLFSLSRLGTINNSNRLICNISNIVGFRRPAQLTGTALRINQYSPLFFFFFFVMTTTLNAASPHGPHATEGAQAQDASIASERWQGTSNSDSTNAAVSPAAAGGSSGAPSPRPRPRPFLRNAQSASSIEGLATPTSRGGRSVPLPVAVASAGIAFKDAFRSAVASAQSSTVLPAVHQPMAAAARELRAANAGPLGSSRQASEEGGGSSVLTASAAPISPSSTIDTGATAGTAVFTPSTSALQTPATTTATTNARCLSSAALTPTTTTTASAGAMAMAAAKDVSSCARSSHANANALTHAAAYVPPSPSPMCSPHTAAGCVSPATVGDTSVAGNASHCFTGGFPSPSPLVAGGGGASFPQWAVPNMSAHRTNGHGHAGGGMPHSMAAVYGGGVHPYVAHDVQQFGAVGRCASNASSFGAPRGHGHANCGYAATNGYRTPKGTPTSASPPAANTTAGAAGQQRGATAYHYPPYVPAACAGGGGLSAAAPPFSFGPPQASLHPLMAAHQQQQWSGVPPAVLPPSYGVAAYGAPPPAYGAPSSAAPLSSSAPMGAANASSAPRLSTSKKRRMRRMLLETNLSLHRQVDGIIADEDGGEGSSASGGEK